MFDLFNSQSLAKCIKFNGSVPCVTDPILNSIKEVLLYELRQLSYYILKLEEMGVVNEDYKDSIIEGLCAISFNLELNREDFKIFLFNIIDKKCDAQKIYIKLCEERDLDCQVLKSYTNECKDLDFLAAIRQGEKQSLQRNLMPDKNKKNLYEILFLMIQNAALNLLELKQYSKDLPSHKIEVIKLLSSTNFKAATEEKLKSRIDRFAKINYEIEKALHNAKIEKFGNTSKTEVNLNLEKGPAILAIGHSLIDLYNLLEATKNTDINIYTHDMLLSAHSYEKFKEYKNLKGHYQKTVDNFEFDLSDFPGTILITRNAQGNFFNIIRGTIFTTNSISGTNIKKIVENNFLPLIEATQKEKVVIETQPEKKIRIGFDKEETSQKIEIIINKIKEKKINNLIIIGTLSGASEKHNEYFERLLSKLPTNCHSISLSYEKDQENVTYINSLNDYFLLYQILKQITQAINFKECNNKDKFNINVLLTQYNLEAVSHIFDLKYFNIEKIYIAPYLSNYINPTIVNSLQAIFNIKQLSNDPKKDLNSILNEKKQD